MQFYNFYHNQLFFMIVSLKAQARAWGFEKTVKQLPSKAPESSVSQLPGAFDTGGVDYALWWHQEKLFGEKT